MLSDELEQLKVDPLLKVERRPMTYEYGVRMMHCIGGVLSGILNRPRSAHWCVSTTTYEKSTWQHSRHKTGSRVIWTARTK